MNLANKYRPKDFEEMTEQSIISDMLRGLCSQPEMDCRNFLLIGPAGTGKAQPLYSKVLTPNGFIEMSDVKIGTEVFTANGYVAKVSGVYPQGVRPIYEINLKDGTSIRVSDEHLNEVYILDEDNSIYTHFTMNTNDLFKCIHKDRIKVFVGIPKVNWPSHVNISDIVEDIDQCKESGHAIPDKYLYSDIETRISILNHIFNGNINLDVPDAHVGLVVGYSFSESLAFLARSLGLVDVVIPFRQKPGSYIHHIKCNIDSFREIFSIDYVGDEACQCIMVDHPDHTYISDGFIPTHNTTLGRIMANTLNDGQCEPIEIDAASHGSIESIRSLVETARQYPVGCKWKVIILDEVHVLSQQCWQVLLKPLESGAAKTIWILCTTNPEKIPATILSRVQTFQLSKISLKGIHDRLRYVLDSEIAEGRNIKYSDDAINYIAKLANGGMRDALTLMDKALAYSEEVSLENIAKSLNLPSYDDYFDLLSAYAKHDNTSIAKIVNDVYNSGVNFVKWFDGFHSFVINVVKYIFLQNIDETMIPGYYKDKISKYSSAHAAICLKLASKLLKMNQELRSTNYLQEIALTYLCSIPKKGS